jgi:hypothetical protein
MENEMHHFVGFLNRQSRFITEVLYELRLVHDDLLR